jgi:hypothetical protein
MLKKSHCKKSQGGKEERSQKEVSRTSPFLLSRSIGKHSFNKRFAHQSGGDEQGLKAAGSWTFAVDNVEIRQIGCLGLL